MCVRSVLGLCLFLFNCALQNGISFSGSTFYNDWTSVCVLLVFVVAIIANSIWIHVSSDGTFANSTSLYYILWLITMCVTWTMMTSVCFHWATVLSLTIRSMRSVYVLLVFVIVNGGFYAVCLVALIGMSDFLKCTYDDYLKNPMYTHRLCESDYCPDLQPWQWKYAADVVCKDVVYSDWLFPIAFGGQILIFLAAIVLLVLGGYVLRRGSRLIQQSDDMFDERIILVMKRSFRTYLAVIIAVAISLGISCVMNLILYYTNSHINAVVWYTFAIWLPTLVPPAGFLVLQWNPRLHGMNWNPSMHIKNRDGDDRNMIERTDTTHDFMRDSWAGISTFPNTEYVPIGSTSVDGSQNVLALSVQLVSPIAISHACFIELYMADLPNGGNDVTGEDVFEEHPMRRPRASISTLIQTGIQRESLMFRRSQSVSISGLTMLSNPQWKRVGFTETVLPTLVNNGEMDSNGGTMQIATFLSVLQVPVVPDYSVLRFVVYELPEGTASPENFGRMRASTIEMDVRAKDSRVSGMAMSPPSRPRVFCEFTCTSSDMLLTEEMNLVARDGSHRVSTIGFHDEMSPRLGNLGTAPHLRIKSMTVSTRTLKENNGFYITKCFQFTDRNEMVIEDMTESVFTNEIPRQYLELLRNERGDDLSRAQMDMTSFEEKCKMGLVAGLYDNLIDQIQVRFLSIAW